MCSNTAACVHVVNKIHVTVITHIHMYTLTLAQYQGEAGDVLVVLQQMDHAVFRRSDLDLIIDKKISLREALCGFQFPLEHLDGRKLWVKSDEGDVLSPG